MKFLRSPLEIANILWVKVINPIMIFITRIAILTFAILFILYLAMNATDVHQSWIRTYVGQHVYQVMVGEGGGTAFLVQAPSGRSYFVTNDHICASSANNLVLLKQDNTPFPMWQHISERSLLTDLCLIESPFKNEGLILAKGTYPGNRVQAVGHPGLMSLTLSNIGEIIEVDSATLSSKAEYKTAPMHNVSNCDLNNPKFKLEKNAEGELICEIYVPRAFYTNVLIQPGNSGSPLVNSFGDVVGVISGVDEYGWGIAVDLHDLRLFLSNR